VCIYNGPKRSDELRSLLGSKRGILLTTYRTCDIDHEELDRNVHNSQFKQYQQAEQNAKVMQDRKPPPIKYIKIREDSSDLCSSDTLISSQANKQQSIPYRAVAFDFMIMDEATEIKNEASQTHQSLKAIRAFFKIALTGTPIMNNVKEMYNLINFLNEGFLGSRSNFVREYDKQIN